MVKIIRSLFLAAVCSALSLSCTKDGLKVSISTVNISHSSLSMAVGENAELSLNIYPKNASDTKVRWISSNPSVATVEKGVVTAISEGVATITASANDGRQTDSCLVSVSDIEKISLTKCMYYLSPGESDTLSFKNHDGQRIKWTSKNPLVAFVSSTGTITARSEGFTVLTGTLVDKTYTVIVNCNGGESQVGSLRLVCTVKGNAKMTSDVCICMPYPQTDDYQNIITIKTNGKVYDSQYSSAQIAKYDNDYYGVFQDSLYVDLVVRTHARFNYVDKSLPYSEYDKNSDIYRQYTCPQGDLIYWDGTSLQQISDRIWSETCGNVIDYAYQCYLYTATHFSYIDGGFPNLEGVLAHDGGDCGGFTLVYLSLLRAKGIPCRPVVCLWIDGSGCHVWSEFYLEDYGWVPVDATFKNGTPDGEFFGAYYGGNVVMNHDYFIDATVFDNKVSLSFLQTCCYWYWGWIDDIDFNYAVKM